VEEGQIAFVGGDLRFRHHIIKGGRTQCHLQSLGEFTQGHIKAVANIFQLQIALKLLGVFLIDHRPEDGPEIGVQLR